MNDRADIGFIDAHTERNGGHHDLDFPYQKLLLHFPTMARVETGMVGGGRETAIQISQQGL